MKNIYLLLIIGFALAISSCYKEETWVDKNVSESLGYYPFIQIVTVANTPESGVFAEGDVAEITVQFWSVDQVKSLDLYATVDGVEALASSTPYTYSYDDDANAEIMTLSYTVPAGTAGTSIGLNVIVINENELTREKSTSITVE